MSRANEYNYMIIGGRVEEVREYLNLNIRNFSKLLGIHYNTYANYKNGSRQIPLNVLKKLTHLYNVSVEWILTGEGKMILETNKVKEEQENYSNSNPELHLLKKLINFEEARPLILQYLIEYKKTRELAKELDQIIFSKKE